MPHYPTALSEPEEMALALDGLSWRLGSLRWPHSAPPMLAERAALVSRLVPEWAVCAGLTAGWVWTGMGRAEPFDLVAPRSPALSPIARASWKPRQCHLDPGTIRRIGSCALLSAEATALDLLVRPGDDQAVAAQLYVLVESTSLTWPLATPANAKGRVQHDRSRRRLALLQQWQQYYPAVTR